MSLANPEGFWCEQQKKSTQIYNNGNSDFREIVVRHNQLYRRVLLGVPEHQTNYFHPKKLSKKVVVTLQNSEEIIKEI